MRDYILQAGIMGDLETSRAARRLVICPLCLAPPGASCSAPRGRKPPKRVRAHVERIGVLEDSYRAFCSLGRAFRRGSMPKVRFKRLIPKKNTPEQDAAWDKHGDVGHSTCSKKSITLDAIVADQKKYYVDWPETGSPDDVTPATCAEALIRLTEAGLVRIRTDA